MILWRDGAYAKADQAGDHDRGRLLGDGVFETVLVEQGRPLFLRAHLDRLDVGMAALGLARPAALDDLVAIAADLARLNGLAGTSALRLTLTRRGGRGLSPPDGATTAMSVTLNDHSSAPPPARLVETKRIRASGASTNGFKCVGAYAENLLARRDALQAGVDEGIMLNEHGRVVGAAAANIFAIDGDHVVTPPESEGALPGVVRGRLIEAFAKSGAPIILAPLTLEAARQSILFLTNSLIGVAPALLTREETVHPLIDRARSAYERSRTEDLQTTR